MLTVMGGLLMMVGSETHIFDLDVGEMLYNFILSPVLS